ncbi:MAG TPA: UvrB/UvrC motif-containing protein [Candidatus Hydrogenedentes bacterium]|nr:UvrB/UvrC motif-containing protein [Candidatus Hydrogenedentota bacterium]
MLCQKCHKSLATIRYAEVVSGNVSELQLCADCMSKLQDEAVSGFELAGVTTAKTKSRPASAPGDVAAEGKMPTRVCRTCGADLMEGIKQSRVGCSACYDAIGDALDSVLRAFHVGQRHRGKVPHVNDERRLMGAELHSLRALLRSTLKSENYEEAAKLRDRIRTLEVSMNVREPERVGQQSGN